MALTKNDLKIALKEQDTRLDKKLAELRKAINLDIADFLRRTVIRQLDGVQMDLDTIDRRLDKIDDRLENHEKRIKPLETPKLA